MATSFSRSLESRSLLQFAALIVGAAFLLVGVLGFIPGVTTSYDDLKFAGHESDAKLLGVFEVSILHNIVHMLFGLVGLAAARTAAMARYYLVGGGAVYLVLFVYGLAIDRESDSNFLPLNMADNFLHLVLGAGMVVLGLLLSAREAEAGSVT
jgi:hypothetical protein